MSVSSIENDCVDVLTIPMNDANVDDVDVLTPLTETDVENVANVDDVDVLTPMTDTQSFTLTPISGH